MSTRTVLNEDDISRALTRISHEVLEANRGVNNLVILGIPTRGSRLASRIADRIHSVEPQFSVADSVGTLDVTMYRDDLAQQPTRASAPTRLPLSGISGKTVILVDDVLYSGRTIRAALDALKDVGRPSRVLLAVLVERGHRELPIRADFVGKNLPSSSSERINVRLVEIDGTEEVTIESPESFNTDPGQGDQR